MQKVTSLNVLTHYSLESLERVQTSVAHCIVKGIAGGQTSAELGTLLAMYEDVETEMAQRSEEIRLFIDQRG